MIQRGNRITIVDVARAAGVSTKTVSRVLNGEPHVTAALQDRVRTAAATLDYHPNVLAQGLARRRSHLIGLVFENPSPSYVVELQMGVLRRLAGERYRLVVLPVGPVQQHEGEVIGLLRSAAVDGVVLGPPASDSRAVIEGLRQIGMPFARIAPKTMAGVGHANLIDDVAAAREAAEHLLALGHRAFAVIKGDPTHPASTDRLRGYRQALDAAGITLPAERVVEGQFSFESGYAAAVRLFAAPERPTAVLVQNDDMAVAAIAAARDAGLSVPADVSIVGFDDSEVSRISWPRLTTVRQPVFAMAEAAADQLLAELEGEGEPTSRVRTHRHQLIVRESTTPPRV